MREVPDEKEESLRAARALNPHPERVTDALFRSGLPFFDARDLVQVKYEMLRRVEHEGKSVREAARAHGFSRPAFYQALHAFKRLGLAGLMRERPGPRRRHKLNEEVVSFLRELRAEKPHLSARDLAGRLRERFGLEVHPRSIERALTEPRKRGRLR